jgi:hypothetical protein
MFRPDLQEYVDNLMEAVRQGFPGACEEPCVP